MTCCGHWLPRPEHWYYTLHDYGLNNQEQGLRQRLLQKKTTGESNIVPCPSPGGFHGRNRLTPARAAERLCGLFLCAKPQSLLIIFFVVL